MVEGFITAPKCAGQQRQGRSRSLDAILGDGDDDIATTSPATYDIVPSQEEIGPMEDKLIVCFRPPILSRRHWKRTSSATPAAGRNTPGSQIKYTWSISILKDRAAMT